MIKQPQSITFAAIVGDFIHGRLKLHGRPVLPSRNITANREGSLCVAAYFSTMMSDFELHHPLTRAQRARFAVKLVEFIFSDTSDSVFLRLSDIAANLGMLLHFKPKLIDSNLSILQMLELHHKRLKRAPKEESPPRKLVASFDRYHLEELTHRAHLLVEASALGHCIASPLEIWTVPPTQRPLLRYGELTYFHIMLVGTHRHFSFGDEKGPLTTIQVDVRNAAITMLGPKFAIQHKGNERYFKPMIHALAWLGDHLGGLSIEGGVCVSKHVIEAIKTTPLATNYPGNRTYISTRVSSMTQSPFSSTMFNMMSGTHEIDGRKVWPSVQLDQGLINGMTNIFGPMVEDLEQRTTLTPRARTTFTNNLLHYVRIRERMGCRKPDLRDLAAVLGMVLDRKPELITETIEQMLLVYSKLEAELPEDEDQPRPRVLKVSRLYHINELTHRQHIRDEAIALGHCIGRKVHIWTVPRAERVNVPCGELHYFRQMETEPVRNFSFADKKGPLTTIQFNIKKSEFTMLGPRFSRMHTGRERYFKSLIKGLGLLAESLGGAFIREGQTISRAVLDGIENDPLAKSHILSPPPPTAETDEQYFSTPPAIRTTEPGP